MSEAGSSAAVQPRTEVLPVHAARERLHQFFEGSAPIVEYGVTAAPLGVLEKGRSDGVVFGLGEVDGLTCMAVSCIPETADDVVGQRGFGEIVRAARIAIQSQVPLVLLLEGGGYRDNEPPFYVQGRDLTSVLAEASRSIPIMGAALGEVRGPLALALGLADLVVAISAATITLSEESSAPAGGSPSPLKRYGAADAVVEGVSEALAVLQRATLLLGAQLADVEDPDAEHRRELLEKMVDGNSRRAIDGTRLTDLVLDDGSGVRLRERFGGAVQTTLGRLGGRTVGVAASHSMVNAAAIDADAATKLGDFIEFCEEFDVPLIYLTDVPGLMAGPTAERTAVNRKSVRPYNAQARSTAPHLTVVIRRGFGQGLVVMGGGHQIPGSVLKLTWPSGQFGVMGSKGAASMRSSSSSGSRDRISVEEAYSELVQRGSAESAAMDFSVDEQISPGDTREALIRLVRRLPGGTTRLPTSEVRR